MCNVISAMALGTLPRIAMPMAARARKAKAKECSAILARALGISQVIARGVRSASPMGTFEVSIGLCLWLSHASVCFEFARCRRSCARVWCQVVGSRRYALAYELVLDMYVGALLLLLSGEGAVVREDGAELLAAIGAFLCTCVV